ncbi:MAG TPA: hypothetical protein VI548_04730 [Chitinophagaceae bacterium]|nr:hypothetical protein [Chitinophagaceae bacterium]
MKWVILIISLLTLLFLSIAVSNNQKSKPGNENFTVIKGRIEYSSGNIIDLYAYPDLFQKYLNNKIIIASAPVDDRGKFSFSYNFYQPSAFDLKIGNRILASNLFLCPGDQITINFPDTAASPQITSNAEGGRNNRFLLLFNEIFFKEPKTMRDYYVNSNFLNIDEYAEFLKTRRLQQIKLYEEFFDESPPEEVFSTYILSEINYQYAIDKLMYLWKKGIKNKQVYAGGDYYDFLSQDFIESPAALNSPSYVHFLNIYFTNLYEEQLFKIQQSKNTNRVDLTFEKLMFAKQKFSGLSLHIITLNILNDEVNSVDNKNG